MATDIHPTAIVDPAARIGRDVRIGPYAIVAGDTVIGDGCRVMACAVICRYTSLGAENEVRSFAALGGEPQDWGFEASEVSYLRIGRGNIFGEGATANRATGEGCTTVIGNDNRFLAAAHVGHNVVVGSGCLLGHSAALAGYVELGDGVVFADLAAVHQFCWIGEGAHVGRCSTLSTHTPPYCRAENLNAVTGLNTEALQQAAHLNDTDRRQVAEAFELTYLSGLPTTKALAEMETHTEWGAGAETFRGFVRRVAGAEGSYRRALANAGRP